MNSNQLNSKRMNSEQILARLIAFDTTSTTSNLQLIDFVRNLLDEQAIASQLVHNDDRSRANLYATIGPDNIGGVMLSGHTDVVPTTGQDWNSDPYQMLSDDQLLIGRGACDIGSVREHAISGLSTTHDVEFSMIGIELLSQTYYILSHSTCSFECRTPFG